MKKIAILTFTAEGMTYGSAPSKSGPARLNQGEFNSSHTRSDQTVEDLIRNEDGSIKQFTSPVSALNYCIDNGWNLEQTLFEPHDGFNARESLSNYIFILSKEK